MIYEKAGMFSERATVDEALKFGNDIINSEYGGYTKGSASSIAALTAMYVLYNTMAQKLNEAKEVNNINKDVNISTANEVMK